MIKRTYLLPEGGNFYKANLHCHSTFSDGKFTPAELKELYKSHGYAVLAITDHNGLFYHPELDDRDFITLAGLELDYNEMRGPDYGTCLTTHLCCYKKYRSDIYQPGFNPRYLNPLLTAEQVAMIKGKGEPFVNAHDIANVLHVIAVMQNEGFIVTYNHPKWSLENYETYSRYLTVNNLEIYNHGCYVAGYDDRNTVVYDDMLRLCRTPLRCVAADDNHHEGDMFGGFTMFKAPALTYEDIMRAFDKGEFYASEGPEIAELWVDDDGSGVTKTLHVRSKTPLQHIRLATGIRYARLKAAPDDDHPVYEADFEIMPKYLYARLELADLRGRRAYTNAYSM